MEMQLPFLITSLVGHNRRLSSIVSSHVQWLEKLLADVEKTLLEDEASMKKRNKDSSLKELNCIYELVVPWDTQFRYGMSLHVYTCYVYVVLLCVIK